MKGWRNLVLVAVAGACVGAQAAWPKWFRGRRVETLVVTGNFAKPRLLAELFQHQTKQPILLINSEGSGEDQLYYLPSTPEAMTLEAGKYLEYVEYLRPARIVFLGDSTFVSQSYIDQVRDRFPTVVLSSSDWIQNGNALGSLIKSKSLAKRYASYFDKIEEASGSLTGGSGQPAAPAVPEPLALPQLVPPARP